MSFRLFSCLHCSHMLRLGSKRCGRCDAPAPFLNWTSTHIAGLAVTILVVLAGVALLPGTS